MRHKIGLVVESIDIQDGEKIIRRKGFPFPQIYFADGCH